MPSSRLKLLGSSYSLHIEDEWIGRGLQGSAVWRLPDPPSPLVELQVLGIGMIEAMDKQFRLSEQNIIGFLATTNPQRAVSFYRDILGLSVVSDESPFALVLDANGILLRVTVVEQVAPAAYTVLGWKVADIVAAVNSLSEAGVEFLRYPGFEQDELGIWTAHGGSRVAWFHDPDGNTLSLSQ